MLDAVLSGDRAAMGRAITMVESTRSTDFAQAQALLAGLLPHGGNALRIGITGVPGAGKSTFIDSLGAMLVRDGHRVAVLAVDPSSARTGGSILGDRTRMARLATTEAAFVRPSPSATTLGGVARATRETIVIVEAAGFDVVMVETVGVGQSEYVVAGMVDTVLLLTLARSGDSLQGIKRGILELADVVAVSKSDGSHVAQARTAARELAGALHLFCPTHHGWQPPVLTCSALQDVGVAEVWAAVQRHREALGEHGLSRKRAAQAVEWTRSLVRTGLLAQLDEPAAREVITRAEADVLSGRSTPGLAADQVLRSLR